MTMRKGDGPYGEITRLILIEENADAVFVFVGGGKQKPGYEIQVRSDERERIPAILRATAKALKDAERNIRRYADDIELGKKEPEFLGSKH